VPRQFFTLDRRMFALLAALLTSALGPNIAAAALGEPESSIQADAAKFQGAVNSSEHLTYRVDEITLASGTLVREYVSQSGAIFAIVWHGPTIPNLRQALGKYFDNYVAAAKNAPVNHRRLDISQTDLVVHASGHMRAFSGIAYLPQAIPSGVSVGELQ
jgi:Protein of unknown function (DUF2844)